MRLAGIILTFNEEKHIQDCIKSLKFADEILVVDSFSTDNTVKLAKECSAEIIQNAFQDYANQRNFALDSVRDRVDWVLFVDADERVTDELAHEIQEVIKNSDYVGWQIPRHNYIFGKLTRGAGWYPDHQTRLLKVSSARYDPERKVHEVVQLDGDLGTLTHHFTHYNYTHVTQFLQKQRNYTAYEAGILREQGIKPKPQNYILQPLRHFRWRFLTLKGYRDGWHGFRLSLFMAWYEFRKYVILHNLWKNKTD